MRVHGDGEGLDMKLMDQLVGALGGSWTSGSGLRNFMPEERAMIQGRQQVEGQSSCAAFVNQAVKREKARRKDRRTT